MSKCVETKGEDMMDKYEIADLELAKLLGWVHIITNKHSRILVGCKRDDLRDFPIPLWTQDNGECFRLTVEHSLSVYIDDHPEGCSCVEVEWYFPSRGQYVANLQDFQDKLAATRYAIVQAVIRKLKGE